jgi:RNA polymerase sigma-70 factor (ECF subfamily)
MPAADDSDASVIRQLIDGQNVEENFRRLFERYYAPVFGFFVRQGLRSDDCRDSTQEVFLAVYSGLKNLRSETAFVSWLFSIARHVGFRRIESQKRTRLAIVRPRPTDGDQPTAAETTASPDPDPLQRLLAAEKIEVVRKALEALPHRVQDCLRARLVDGLKYSQIGERLGISENTVAVHVHRGLRSLKIRLKEVLTGAPFHGEA